ncbi:neprilysin-1-like [Ornithodoros turicata]|uniref:neprilysin-1-like n=1 Tax=Ornithodoros turicata TaxID=34597 RepID=UPI0031390537
MNNSAQPRPTEVGAGTTGEARAFETGYEKGAAGNYDRRSPHLKEPPNTLAQEGRDISQEQKKFKTTGTIMCAIIFVGVITIIVVKIIRVGKYDPLTDDDVCNTFDCMIYEQLLKASLDRSLDPCENFYRYVCSAWDRTHARSVLDQHRRDHLKMISGKARDIKAPPTDQSATEKAAKYYQSCIELAFKNRSEISEFREMMKDGNITWPHSSQNSDFLQMMAHAIAKWDVSPVLQFQKIIRNETVVLTISPGRFVSAWHETRSRLIASGRYYQYFSRLYDVFGVNAPSMATLDMMNNVEDKIMTSLLHGLLDESTAELEEDALINASTAFSYERWRQLFKDVLDVPNDQKIVARVVSLDYFKELNAVTKEQTESAMINFFSQAVLFEIGHLFLPDVANLVYVSKEEAVEAALFRCLYHVERHMELAITMPHLYDVIPSVTQWDVTALYENVSFVVERHVRVLSPEYVPRHHANASGILGAFDRLLKPSELDQRFARFPNMGTSFSTNFLKVVAATRLNTGKRARYLHRVNYSRLYDVALQRITLTPFVLTLPVYAVGVPAAVRYGSLGSLILASVAEDIYRNDVSKMKSNVREKFTNVESCLRDMRVTAASLYSIVGTQLLKQAYDFGISRERHTELDEQASGDRLRELREFSQLQLMFVAACFLQCAGSKRAYEDACNVPLQNVKDFALVFKCSSHSFMNPQKKCTIF